MKNSLKGFKSGLHKVDKRISDLKVKSLETVHSEEQKEKKKEKE